MTPRPSIYRDAAPPDSPIPRIALRPAEASIATGIKSRKLYELVRAGRIPHFRLDKCLFFPVAELTQWCAEQAKAAAGGK